MRRLGHRESGAGEARFGYLHSFGLIVLCSVWFAGVHRLAQAVVASCDASASVLTFALMTIIAGWIGFVGCGFVAVAFVVGWGRHLSRAVTGLAVALWLLVVSWTYLVIATSTLTDPVLMSVGCPGGAPAWWPVWVPLF